MVYENILEAVGNTPLIRLHHMTGEEDAQIFVKFEAVNVGASIKTRTAKEKERSPRRRSLWSRPAVTRGLVWH